MWKDMWKDLLDIGPGAHEPEFQVLINSHKEI